MLRQVRNFMTGAASKCGIPAPESYGTSNIVPRGQGAPDSVSRSVVRAGAQAAARNTLKRGAPAAVPAPQASLTVSRQPPDSVSRSVVREGVQAGAGNAVKRGAPAAAPAPQAPLTVSRQPSQVGCGKKCGICIVLSGAWSLGNVRPRRRALACSAAQLRSCNATRGAALLGFVVPTTTFVARLAAIRILPATRLTKDLIRGSIFWCR